MLKVTKSTLSMFLRTKCDKELFLSLHDKALMAGMGLPKPLKRPGIGILAIEGRDFEFGRNETLVRLFPRITHFSQTPNSFNHVDLNNVLTHLQGAPALILQGKFSIAHAQPHVLDNIGLTAAESALVPALADFIPDVISVQRPVAGDMEVKSDGSRVAIDQITEQRLGLIIFDIKHTAEANPSYCSEIAMYALMLANWLELNAQLSQRFYVSSQAYLWTRSSQGNSKLEELDRAGNATEAQLLGGLIEDSEDAQLRFYLSAIRRFFESVARVVRIGQARPNGWEDLEWHVSGSCGSCDWLGDKRHMGQDQRVVVDANPTHYCMPLAASSGHLCLVPGITRGAKKVLSSNTVTDTNALAAAVGHPALQQHTLLKREAKSLPARSTAITTGALSRDVDGVIASLVPSANLLLYASINFDSSSGLLTGLALSGTATNFQIGVVPRRFPAVPYVIDQKSLAAEWVALEGFLTQIANCVDVAERLVTGGVKAQVHFWERRQFQELCNAMGRHLPRIMTLADRRAKALVWIFPPDEMIARPDSLEAATIVAVDEIIQRMIFSPTKHVVTLFDTVDHYRQGPFAAVNDSYYREYLSNGIPRERIYEIWSNLPQVRRGAGNVVPRNTVISQFSDALSKQSRALEAVCEKLRHDYRGSFKARATRLPTTILRGATGVAFDAKLWLWWDELEFNASQLEAHIRLSVDGERLEATYEAIILNNGFHLRGELYEFTVSQGSADAKFKEDSMLTIGKLGRPGVPLQYASNLLNPGAPVFQGNQDLLTRPLWSVLEAKLLNFDRVNLRAQVQLRAKDDPTFAPYLIANAAISLLDQVFLVEGKKPKMFNWAEHSSPILTGIGNPAIATPDNNARIAMGIAPPARRGPASPETPAAKILWNPPSLEQRVVVDPIVAHRWASHIQNLDGLNDPQKSAVEHGIERGLTLIWGPPGTGKTKTLSAMLHAMALHAIDVQEPLRILVTGPTYKAVEEVMHRASKMLSADGSAASALYMAYSQGRAAGVVPRNLAPHVSFKNMMFDNADPNWIECIDELQTGVGVVIVGCQIRQARRFAKHISGRSLHPVFDVVVIDESSQVPVSHSLSALSGLSDDSRLIVAGDHLQMPPIASIEAPAEAAYLVGSIQTYLTKRQFAAPVPPCVLDRNYRSGEHVVAFARTIGYPPSLTAEYGNARVHLLQPLPERQAYPAHLPWCPLFGALLSPNCVVGTLLHEDDVSSQGNHFEAQLVAGMIWMLRESVSAALDHYGIGAPHHRSPTPSEFWGACVGVVTPHRAQRALVIRELERLFPHEANLIADAVDTVERFQGGERHTILVTFGVADVDIIGGEEAFLMQLERTNVAVSRAMGKCVVIMPDALAAHIPEDKRALQTAYALKSYVEEFCDYRENTTVDRAGVVRRAQVRYKV